MAARKIMVRARPTQPVPPPLQSLGGIDALYSLLGLTSGTAQLPVSETTVRGLPGAWAAVNKISNAVAQMMVAAEVFAADGVTIIATPPVVDQPNVSYDSFVFWKEAVSTGLMRGNYVAIRADYDSDGWPRQVVPVPIDSVDAYYDEDGFVVYDIAGQHYSPEEIVHVRIGITVPGQIMAIGVVEAHRRGLAGMLAQQGMANSVWTNGAVPSGMVKLDVDQPTEAQATTVKGNFVSLLGGQRTVGVIGKRMEYTPITWSADDAQFLESRQFSIAETCLMFGLRPETLGTSFGTASGSESYGNRTDDALQTITDSYTPVMFPCEQAWSRLVPGRAFVRGSAEALLRSSTKERLETRKLAQEIGIETAEESRAFERRGPAPKADPPEIPDPTDTTPNGE